MPGETELKVYFLSSIHNIPQSLFGGLVAMSFWGIIVLAWRFGWRRGLRASAVLMLAEWLFLILCTAIIFRESRVERGYNLIPFDSYFHYPENCYFVEAAAVNMLNVILFVPFGLLLGCGFRGISWKKVLLIGLGISFSIELLQYIFNRGFCETDDLIHNILGCILGFAVYKLFTSLIKYVQAFF